MGGIADNRRRRNMHRHKYIKRTEYYLQFVGLWIRHLISFFLIKQGKQRM